MSDAKNDTSQALTSLQILPIQLLRPPRIEPPPKQHLPPPNLLPLPLPLPICTSLPSSRRLLLARRPDVMRAREAPEALELRVGQGGARKEVLEDGDLRGDVRAVGLGGLALREVVHGDGGERGGVEDVREVREEAHSGARGGVKLWRRGRREEG